MGYGSYTAGDWQKLKISRNLGASQNADQTFVRRNISDKLNSKFIDIRESFDSDDSPNSTPIILGFDVTGSMGFLANEIATKSLNDTITKILSNKIVVNPHFMCAAFTDKLSPLQVTQFEADIRVTEQLLDFVLGGGNQYSFDNLLWYFAAKHTVIDSYRKRGKKGFLISIGDEICGADKNTLFSSDIKAVFNDHCYCSYSFNDTYKMASEQYEVVHIVIGKDWRFDKKCNNNSYDGWQQALPGRVGKIKANDVEYLSDVIIAIIKLLNGASKQEVTNNSMLTPAAKSAVAFAIEDMNIVED